MREGRGNRLPSEIATVYGVQQTSISKYTIIVMLFR